MTVPKFDPWSVMSDREPRAHRAYCAYAQPKSGTLGTVSARASLENSDFDARIETWLTRLSDPSTTGAYSGRQVEFATSFCEAPWCRTLLALGWDVTDLLSVCETSAKSSGLLVSLVGSRIVAATTDSAVLVNERGVRFRHWRGGRVGGGRIEQERGKQHGN